MPRSSAVFVVDTVPATFVPLPCVVSSPPVKVRTSLRSLPNVIVPVFRNVVSVSIVVVVPSNATLYAPPNVAKVFTVALPVTVTPPVWLTLPRPSV